MKYSKKLSNSLQSKAEAYFYKNAVFFFSDVIFHHAYTQTPQKQEKLPPEKKTCRDTQTAEEREKIYVSII